MAETAPVEKHCCRGNSGNNTAGGRHEDHHFHPHFHYRLRLRLPWVGGLRRPSAPRGQIRAEWPSADPGAAELLLPSTTTGSAPLQVSAGSRRLVLSSTRTRRSRALQQVGFNATARSRVSSVHFVFSHSQRCFSQNGANVFSRWRRSGKGPRLPAPSLLCLTSQSIHSSPVMWNREEKKM